MKKQPRRVKNMNIERARGKPPIEEETRNKKTGEE